MDELVSRADFLSAASTATTDDCIVWPFAVRKSSGYGAFGIWVNLRRVNIDAHVYVCTLAHGERPDGLQAAHACGNKLCCNGRHLRWATPRENMLDAHNQGRMRGGGRYRQRLNDADVRDIRASRESLVDLSGRYGVDPSYLGRIRSGAARTAVSA